MADVKIVDIDGEQWNIKDQIARNNIAEMEKTISTQDLPGAEVTMMSGYTCTSIETLYHYKVGNIHFLLIRIADLSGSGVNTSTTIRIAKTSLHPRRQTSFILRDYRAPATARGVLDPDGALYLGESNGIKNGNNVMLGEIIFGE